MQKHRKGEHFPKTRLGLIQRNYSIFMGQHIFLSQLIFLYSGIGKKDSIEIIRYLESVKSNLSDIEKRINSYLNETSSIKAEKFINEHDFNYDSITSITH